MPALVVLGGTVAHGATLDVTVTSGGASQVTVLPGMPVDYEVNGVLSSAADNGGLALVLLDLSFDGGPLDPADTPTTEPMASFVLDMGITNPAGFGGTVINGTLVQVGGSQNTINNDVNNAPFPIGTVTVNVAHPPDGQVLVTGSLTAPLTPGTYVLGVANIQATVIQAGQDGNPFWATELATGVAVSNLTVDVVAGGPIPTVSEWGMIALACTLLVAGGVVIVRRGGAAVGSRSAA
ncbi:MAG: IPTL-CTERM sorting domain-containing protein [Phycisphaerae bacterium]